MGKRNIKVWPGQRLRDAERQTTSMALPVPIHRRLDELVKFARDANPSRAEMVAMLIATAPLDGDELEGRLLAYRKLKVWEVLPGEREPSTDEDSVVVPIHGPGRRRRTDERG